MYICICVSVFLLFQRYSYVCVCVSVHVLINVTWEMPDVEESMSSQLCVYCLWMSVMSSIMWAGG